MHNLLLERLNRLHRRVCGEGPSLYSVFWAPEQIVSCFRIHLTCRHGWRSDRMITYPQQRQSQMQSTIAVKHPTIAAFLSSEVPRGWFRNGPDGGKGVPATMHSRQSAIAPIIPMIHSPMQAIIPARQETMHPISARKKRT